MTLKEEHVTQKKTQDGIVKSGICIGFAVQNAQMGILVKES